MKGEENKVSAWNISVLVTFCVATVLLIPLEIFVLGIIFWLGAAILVVKSNDNVLRRNMGILLAVILLLAFTPINTDLRTSHCFTLGIPYNAKV